MTNITAVYRYVEHFTTHLSYCYPCKCVCVCRYSGLQLLTSRRTSFSFSKEKKRAQMLDDCKNTKRRLLKVSISRRRSALAMCMSSFTPVDRSAPARTFHSVISVTRCTTAVFLFLSLSLYLSFLRHSIRFRTASSIN